MSLGFGLTMPLQRSSFKRASRSHAKTGSFFSFCGCLFSRAFSAGRQHEIFQFSCVCGSLEGGLFGAFLVFVPFSCENGDPSFLHTITAFWLDFQGLGPPRITKTRKKGLLKKHPFLGFIKMDSEAVFIDFFVFSGSVLEVLDDPES